MAFKEEKIKLIEIWEEVKKEYMEYMEAKGIPFISIEFDVKNEYKLNMHSNAKNKFILCDHGVYGLTQNVFRWLIYFENDESDDCENVLENYSRDVIKTIMWHEIFHILLGHQIEPKDKEKIVKEKNEIVLQQLEYMADAMAIYNYFPFLLDGTDNERKLALYLIKLYAYYYVQSKGHIPVITHPEAEIRMELILVAFDQAVELWNNVNKKNYISLDKIKMWINMLMAGFNPKLEMPDLENMQQKKEKITNIDTSHWIWKNNIKPVSPIYNMLDHHS